MQRYIEARGPVVPLRQGAGETVRCPPRLSHVRIGGGGIGHRLQYTRVPVVLAPVGFLVRCYSPRRQRCAHIGHKRQRNGDASRCHVGAAFNCRLWSISPRSMGGRRRARCCWRSSEAIGVAGDVRAARWCNPARPYRTDMVEHKPTARDTTRA